MGEFVAEEVANDGGLLLGGSEIGANTADHLPTCGRALAAEGVGLDVVVEELVGVEVRAVGRQEEDLDLNPVSLEPPSYRSGLVRRMTVDDQEDPVSYTHLTL